MFPTWQHGAMSKLREYRLSQGLSQEEFAKSVLVRKATISRIENGQRMPSVGLQARIRSISNGALSADDLLPSKPDQRDDQANAHADDGAAADPVDAHETTS